MLGCHGAARKTNPNPLYPLTVRAHLLEARGNSSPRTRSGRASEMCRMCQPHPAHPGAFRPKTLSRQPRNVPRRVALLPAKSESADQPQKPARHYRLSSRSSDERADRSDHHWLQAPLAMATAAIIPTIAASRNQVARTRSMGNSSVKHELAVTTAISIVRQSAPLFG